MTGVLVVVSNGRGDTDLGIVTVGVDWELWFPSHMVPGVTTDVAGLVALWARFAEPTALIPVTNLK